MKRKLIAGLVLMMLGGLSPKLYDGLAGWWNAPPEQPRSEAARLIESLESAQGWKVDKRVFPGPASDYTVLKKNDIRITLHVWRADVDINGMFINDSFTNAELRAINNAAVTCLRKLTARAMDVAAQ